MKNKAIRQYLAQLKRNLICSADDRKRFLSQGEALLAEFAEENPNTQYCDLTQAFGQPKDLASEMLSQLEPAEVARAHRQRKYIRRGIMAAVAIILVLLAAFWYSRYKTSESLNDNAIIVIGPAEQLTDEEAKELEEKMLEEAQHKIGE